MSIAGARIQWFTSRVNVRHPSFEIKWHIIYVEYKNTLNYFIINKCVLHYEWLEKHLQWHFNKSTWQRWNLWALDAKQLIKYCVIITCARRGEFVCSWLVCIVAFRKTAKTLFWWEMLVHRRAIENGMILMRWHLITLVCPLKAFKSNRFFTKYFWTWTKYLSQQHISIGIQCVNKMAIAATKS